jgi:hypothetical protein
MAGFRCDANCIGKVLFFDESGLQGESGFDCTARPNYAIEDESGQIWYADQFSDFRTAPQWNSGCERMRFNKPYSSNVSEMVVQDNVLYIASGGVTDGYGYKFLRDGFFIFRDGDWETYNEFNQQPLKDAGILDYFRILPHPDNSKVYIGSYWAGLVEYDFENYTFYDQENSSIQGAVGDDIRERVAGLAFDDQQNLWISNFLAPRPIVVLSEDGSWFSYSVPGSTNLAQVVVDERGYKWFVTIGSQSGLLVFDDGGTLDVTSDDRYSVITDNNSMLPSNTVNTIAVDLDGDIWAGTSEGPVVFDGAADPFNGDNLGFRIKIEQDELISYLLGEEEILSIAIDGANRKWCGTRNGVFVQSANGEVEVANFNSHNSPLLDDEVIDIAINQQNGEVFIGTNSGIMSVRTEAIEGGSVHSTDVYAFPNPVRPDYEGTIAIRGFARDSDVKITDVTGQLIFETKSLGGQAIWDGKDFSGRRASTGVYLVFATNMETFNKPDALVTKILVIH